MKKTHFHLIFTLLLSILPYFLTSISGQSEPCNPIDLGPLTTIDASFDCSNGNNTAYNCSDGNFSDSAGNFESDCWSNSDPVEWYQFATLDNAEILNVLIESDGNVVPAIQLFLSLDGTCNTLQPIGLTENNVSCDKGFNGSLKSLASAIGENSIYYLAVANDNGTSEMFELCLQVFSDQSACVVDQNIKITSRSMEGPLDGPFFLGEEIQVCMNVISFTPVGNSCQWFQGIVPVFGDGWDPSSFDDLAQPMNAELNGSPFPAPNLTNEGIFDWWTTVSYHHDNCLINIGDFDNNGRLDLCSPILDPNCSGSPLLGSTSSSECWYDEDPGTILPGGWFTSGVQGQCPSNGYPGVDWGDGNSCAGIIGPWSFCFDLKVREDCQNDSIKSDLRLGFFSFADGETGSWSGGASICGLDLPAFIYPQLIEETFDLQIQSNQACSEAVDTLVLSPIISSLSGSGYSFLWSNGSTDSILTIPNPIDEVEITLIVTNEAGCIVTELYVIDINGQIDLELVGNLEFDCEEITEITVKPIDETVEIISYEWIIPGPDTVNTPTIILNLSGSYQVNVVTLNGCVGELNFIFNLNEVPELILTTTDSLVCENETPSIDALVISGIPPFTYDFENPNMQGPGLYTIIVTDANGCSDTNSIEFGTPQVPVSDFNIGVQGSQVIVTDSSQNAITIFWNFGNGFTSNNSVDTIEYDSNGVYEIQLIAVNECGVSDTSSQFVTIMTTSFDISTISEFKIYPNPAKDIFIIEGELSKVEGQIIMMNILGQEVNAFEYDQIQSSDEKIQMDVSELENGLYYLIFYNENYPQVFEVFIQR